MRLVPIQRGGRSAESLGQLPESANDVLAATAGLYESVGFVPPWICYLAAEGEQVIGTCGFKAAPSQGRVEIAYATFPGHEGKGIATRMARQLIAIASTADPSVIIAAQTLPERNASHRVLEKLRFRCVGPLEHPEDGIVLEWRLTEPSRGNE